LFNRVEPRGARFHSRAVRAWHVSTSQLTLGRSPTRGGAAASWDKFENLSGA
jgi:hypothetical protein